MKKLILNDRVAAWYDYELTEIDRRDHYYDGYAVLNDLELWSEKQQKWLPVRSKSMAEKLILDMVGGIEALEEQLFDEDELFQIGEESGF